MASIARRAALLTAGAVVLVTFAAVSRELASRAGAPLSVDIGPGTGAYLEGFTESEERLPNSFRWTRERASVTLPLDGRHADATLRLRYARFLPDTARVRVFVNGASSGAFDARSGRFRTVELPIRLGRGPIEVAFAVEDPAPERLGIAMDWMRVEGAQVGLAAPTYAPAALVAGVFLLAATLGFSLPWALTWGVVIALLQALWFALDPFAMAHVHREIVMLALVAAAAVALPFRRVRLLPMLFLAGLLLKGAVLFHPSYWYPDVRLHRRYVEAFREAKGGLLERGIEAQKASGTAYARELVGRDYAFPYSPLFYVPFAALEQDARGLERTMKRAGLLLAAIELPLVYLLARSVAGAGVAIWAAGLVVLLPPISSRLLYAQWPTLGGHVLDLVMLGFASRLVARPESAREGLRYAAAGLATCLVYISSLFHFTVFTTALAALHPRRAVRWLLAGIAVGAITLALLYLPFLRLLVTEVLPAVRDGTPLTSTAAERPALVDVLARVPLFFGYGFPALSLAGLLLMRDRGPAFRFFSAYAVGFLLLLGLRAASGAFKDLKEMVFVGPFVAMTAGASLASLASRGSSGRFAALCITAGLAGCGLSTLGSYAAQHTMLAGLD